MPRSSGRSTLPTDIILVDDSTTPWRETTIGRVPGGEFVGVEFVVQRGVAIVAVRSVTRDGTTVGTLFRRRL